MQTKSSFDWIATAERVEAAVVMMCGIFYWYIWNWLSRTPHTSNTYENTYYSYQVAMSEKKNKSKENAREKSIY